MKGNTIAILGLTNGMIGGTILVIPLIGLKTGYLLIPMIAIFYGAISCYTAYLITHHLGECKNIRESILEHFHNKHYSTVIYNVVIGLSLLGFLINYFHLIVLQIQGFIPKSPYIAIGVFVALFFLTIIMRFLHFGEKLLALGILSIIGYCSFLVWAQVTAPSGPKTIPAFGDSGIDLAASLIMGYATHDFIAQVLLNTTTHQNYTSSVMWTYGLGILAYTFITYGCFAIVNREPRVDDPQTISQFFSYGSWQIEFIQLIYFFHLMTASPEFCHILRIRWLQIFKIEQTDKITIPQLLIYLGVYGFCYFLYAAGIGVATVIEINGSIIGVLYIFVIPIAVHIKCVYFSKHDNEGYMISEEENEETGEIIEYYGSCRCKMQYKSQYRKHAQLILQIMILLIGCVTIFFTMKNLFFKSDEVPVPSVSNSTETQHLAQWHLDQFLL